MKRFDQQTTLLAPKTQAPFKSAKRESPSNTRNAFLPAMISLPAGFCTFVGLCMLALAFKWPFKVVLIGTGGTIIIVAAFWIIWLAKDDLLWTVETIVGADITHDGYTGPPPGISFELNPAPNVKQFGTLPGPPEVILEWARVAISGGSLAYSSWDDKFGTYTTKTGHKVELYRAFRNELRTREWIVEQGTHSATLTDEGLNYMRDLASKTAADAVPLLEGRR